MLLAWLECWHGFPSMVCMMQDLMPWMARLLTWFSWIMVMLGWTLCRRCDSWIPCMTCCLFAGWFYFDTMWQHLLLVPLDLYWILSLMKWPWGCFMMILLMLLDGILVSPWMWCCFVMSMLDIGCWLCWCFGPGWLSVAPWHSFLWYSDHGCTMRCCSDYYCTIF